MTEEDLFTTIPIRISTRKRLKNFGTMNDNYDSVINRLLDMAEEKSKNNE